MHSEELLVHDVIRRDRFLVLCAHIIWKGHQHWSITEDLTVTQAVSIDRCFVTTLRWEAISEPFTQPQVSWTTINTNSQQPVLSIVAYADDTQGFFTRVPAIPTLDAFLDQVERETAQLFV